MPRKALFEASKAPFDASKHCMPFWACSAQRGRNENNGLLRVKICKQISASRLSVVPLHYLPGSHSGGGNVGKFNPMFN